MSSKQGRLACRLDTVEVKCGWGNVQPQVNPVHPMAQFAPLHLSEDAAPGAIKWEERKRNMKQLSSVLENECN